MQLGKQFDHTSARDDEHHDVVKVRIVVDALNPRRIRRARIRQRGDDADRHQKDWKDRSRKPTADREILTPHEQWICSPLRLVKPLSLLLYPERCLGRAGSTLTPTTVPRAEGRRGPPPGIICL
jgi:hypothetical protein